MTADQNPKPRMRDLTGAPCMEGDASETQHYLLLQATEYADGFKEQRALMRTSALSMIELIQHVGVLDDLMSPDLYRTLRDIRDGHITLYVHVARFDPFTGEPIEPHEASTSPDRAPAGNTLKAMPGWWRELSRLGWLRLPAANEPSVWMLTDGAQRALDDSGRATGSSSNGGNRV
jgi:hypothetical protein